MRVAVVNDYEIVVAGVRAMLAGQARVTLVDLDLTALDTGSVDVVLYDTFGQHWHDQSHLRALIARSRAKVVVFTWGFDPGAVSDAFASGARGYLSKGLPADELAGALDRVLTGEVVLGATLPQPTQPDQPDQPDPNGWPGRDLGITSRESEILAFITQGLTNPEIAAAMFLSVNSIKTYIRTLYRKIGAERRSQAVRYGVEHGYAPHRTSAVG